MAGSRGSQGVLLDLSVLLLALVTQSSQNRGEKKIVVAQDEEASKMDEWAKTTLSIMMYSDVLSLVMGASASF